MWYVRQPLLSYIESQRVVGLTLSTCPQVKRQELQDLPAVPRGHLVISLEDLQVTLDVAGKTVLSYVHQLLCAD